MPLCRSFFVPHLFFLFLNMLRFLDAFLLSSLLWLSDFSFDLLTTAEIELWAQVQFHYPNFLTSQDCCKDTVGEKKKQCSEFNEGSPSQKQNQEQFSQEMKGNLIVILSHILSVTFIQCVAYTASVKMLFKQGPTKLETDSSVWPLKLLQLAFRAFQRKTCSCVMLYAP